MKMSVRFFLVCLVVFASCKKYEEVTVPNNTAPPDTTVESVIIDDYISRSAIMVLGREADSTEEAHARKLFRDSSFSKQTRMMYLDDLFADPDYRLHTYEKWRGELLGTVDSTDVNDEIILFNSLLSNSSFQSIWPIIRVEINRLVKLQDTTRNYIAGNLPLKALQLAMVDNYFYDQINMGAANFVISTFQHFVNRNPEVAEQTAGVVMVNGQYANLFLVTGGSKDDYLNILFSSNDYAAGMVARAYEEFLLRKPGSVELMDGVDIFNLHHDVVEVQQSILASDEYAGVH